jgi:Fe-S cluster biogenesis protein NfuA
MSDNQISVQITIEQTPNPATLKFNLSKQIIEAPQDFPSAQEAHNSPLASKLFGFPWTNAVFIGPNFVTVTKQDWVDWDILAEPLAGLIREHLERGEPVYIEPHLQASNDEEENDSPIIKQIKRILSAEIRPVVAMDGGDITFANYNDGILAIHMKGACAGCPSSTATLKEGIEARFKELMPADIKEVISV